MKKGAKMPKLGFLPGAMRAQEGSCVRKKLHAYVGWNLHVYKLKNRYMHARTSLRTHKYRLSTQEHVCACKPEPAHARMNTEGCSSTFSKFSQSKLNLNMFLPLLKCQVFI